MSEVKPDSVEPPVVKSNRPDIYGIDDLRIGAVVRKFRERLDMGQKEFSKAMGYSSPEWCAMIESGARKMDIDLAAKAAQILKINPKDFTLLALSQYYPATYRELFGTKNPSMPTEKETPAVLLPDTYEMLTDYEKLPRHERDLIRSMINALKRNNRSTMHMRRASRT